MRAVLKALAALALALLLPLAALAQDISAFEVERLNPGLPPPEPFLDRATPQSSMEAFMALGAEGDWQGAAHLLDLSGIPRGDQASRGPELAEWLHVVIDRKVVIPWGQLLERPDQLDETASDRDPLAGQPRRSILLGLLELDGRAVAVRLNRIKPEDGPAVWVFARPTVDNAEALWRAHGPTWLERSLPDWARTEGPSGLKVWEWIAVPLMLGLALLIGVTSWRIFTVVRGRTPIRFAHRLIEALRLPVTLLLVTIFVHWTTSEVFVISGILDTLLGPLTVLGYVAATMAFAVNVIDAVLDRLVPPDIEDLTSPEEEGKRAVVTTISAARRVTVILAVLVGTGILLSEAQVFRVLGFSLLASAGAVAFVLSFAARDVIGNIMSSLQISLNRSARVGDQLIYDDKFVTVEAIYLTYVQLRVWDGTRIIVPVLKFVSEAFENWSIEEIEMMRPVNLRLSNRIDLEKMREEFGKWCEEREDIINDDRRRVLVVGQDETGMDVRFDFAAPDPTKAWTEECRTREHLLKVATRLEREAEDDYVPHLGLSPHPAARKDLSDTPQHRAEEDNEG